MVMYKSMFSVGDSRHCPELHACVCVLWLAVNNGAGWINNTPRPPLTRGEYTL